MVECRRSGGLDEAFAFDFIWMSNIGPMLAIEGRMEGGVFDFGCPLIIIGEGEDEEGLRITGGEMAFRWRFAGTGGEDPLDLGAMGMLLLLFFIGGGGINFEEEDEDPDGGR